MNIRKSHLLASNWNNGSVPLRMICRYIAEYRSFPLQEIHAFCIAAHRAPKCNHEAGSEWNFWCKETAAIAWYFSFLNKFSTEYLSRVYSSIISLPYSAGST